MSLTLYEVIQSQLREAMEQLYTSLPAEVIAVKKKGKTTTVDVQPMLNKRMQDGRVIQEPPLGNVVVKWPSFGGCYITGPIDVGDTVMLNFSMRSSAEYKNSDGGEPQTATSDRLHNMNDAYATLCTTNFKKGLEAPEDGLELGSGAIEIVVGRDGNISLGKEAAEQLILGTTFMELYNTLSVPTGVGPSGPPIVLMQDALHLSQQVKTQ